MAGPAPAGSSTRSPYGISPVASSTRLTRSQPATLRGSSASTQPMARTGKASTVKRKATLTSSVTLIAPWRSRNAPTTSTARVPRLGSVSSSGSKTPRSRPTAISESRSSPARPANRAVSWASRPIVLTTRAPSKLSWAIAADLGAQPLRAGLPGRHPAGVDDVEREQRGEDRQPDQGEHPVGDEERARSRRPASPACPRRTAAARSGTRPPRRRSWRWTAGCRWSCGGARTAAAPGTGG